MYCVNLHRIVTWLTDYLPAMLPHSSLNPLANNIPLNGLPILILTCIRSLVQFVVIDKIFSWALSASMHARQCHNKTKKIRSFMMASIALCFLKSSENVQLLAAGETVWFPTSTLSQSIQFHFLKFMVNRMIVQIKIVIWSATHSVGKEVEAHSELRNNFLFSFEWKRVRCELSCNLCCVSEWEEMSQINRAVWALSHFKAMDQDDS